MQDFYTHSNLVELMNEHARVPMDTADGQCFHAYTLANLIKADTSTFSSVLGALATVQALSTQAISTSWT